MTTKSRCPGCKTKWRMGGPCSILNCITKKDNIEFCWECPDADTCTKWNRHCEYGRHYDSFVCYQKLDDNINFAKSFGAKAFAKQQAEKAELLQCLLDEFNEGRSKSFYCVVATVLETDELRTAIDNARRDSTGLDIKAKAKLMRAIVEVIADERGYHLTLRKRPKAK